jgi:hypothetical protein
MRETAGSATAKRETDAHRVRRSWWRLRRGDRLRRRGFGRGTGGQQHKNAW